MLFKSIATLATFALGAVSVFAAPAAEPEAALVKKQSTPASIPQIFADATTQLTPLTQQLCEFFRTVDMLRGLIYPPCSGSVRRWIDER